MTPVKVIVALLIAGVVLVVAARLVPLRTEALRVSVARGEAAVGSPAPDFSTQTLDGATVRLSQLRGKPVLLDFWATWCTACEAEMPAFQREAERYRSQGMTVLAVNYRQTDRTEMRNFLSRLGTRFPAVFDPDARIASAYGVSLGLPVSVFIDRAGKVSYIQLGQISSPALDDKVRSIL